VFERMRVLAEDRSSEIVLGLESTEGNAPSAEDTQKNAWLAGAERQMGGKSERPWMVT